jgi:integrase
MQLLRSLYREEGNPFVFIGRMAGTPTANNTVLQALRRAGCDATVHGFRASFKTFSEERTSFPSIIAEMSLAHSVGNAVEQAYRRTDLTAKRRKLMEAWGKYCTTPTITVEKKGGNVLTMRGTK